MMKLSRNRRAAALGLILAASWPAGLAAQDTNTVGNPQLRDFQLPGQRTTPPAQPQALPVPAPTTTRPAPAPVTTANPPPPATATSERRARSRTAAPSPAAPPA